MKYLLILFPFLTIAYGQNLQGIDSGELSKALRLENVELKIDNVTERESATRGIQLKSAWIVSVPDHPLLFPLVIYTSEEGLINDNSIHKLRESFKNSQDSSNEISKEYGVFNLNGVGDCVVFLDELRISSNKPEGVEGVIVPWRPNRKAAISIIGTGIEQKLDFQISLLLADEDKIGDFPEYKRMLYGPDAPRLKDIAADLIVALSNANIIPAKITKPIKSDQDSGMVETGSKAETPNYNKWIWISLISGLVLMIYFVRAKGRSK